MTSAISASYGLRPSLPSTKNKIKSVSKRAFSTWDLISWFIISLLEISSPPVSTSRNSSPCHSTLSTILSLVTPLISSVMDFFFPTSLLNNVDFPTLVLPTNVTIGIVIINTHTQEIY